MKAIGSRFSVVLSVFAFIASGCAGTPTIGDKINQFGKTTSQIGSDWNDGESMVKKGMKLRDEAESLAKKSTAKNQESERLIEEGKRKMSENEVAFREQFGTSMK